MGKTASDLQVQNNISNLLSIHEEPQYFAKTLKIFEKISKKTEPVLKLKLIGELERQFNKDL